MKSNRVRGLAVTTAIRSHAAPDIPTLAETLPGYEAMSWFAVIGPKGLPQDVIGRWNTEINRILRLPDVKERMESQGIELAAGSPEVLREVIRREIAKWQRVVKLINIKPES
jgi:tripartite-type tricarboxylate transporter receptor subunit TctC